MSVLKGAYSRQYQEIQREQLRVLSESHRSTTENYKVRTRHITKENERRRRALEDKKEAFAKAEVERRKEALELRRKGQQEATLRFRNVARKPLPKPPEKKPIIYPTKATPSAYQKIQAIVTSLHPTPPPPRVVYGHEAEVSNTLNLNKNGLPTVDELLRSLRTASEPCTSSESKSSDSASNNTEEKSLDGSHDSNAFKGDGSNTSSVSTVLNRRCSLSDTEILNTKFKCERPLAPVRSFRVSSPLRVCRSGSFDNVNFRQLKKGSVAEEVLNELQCDSSLLQKTLENNELYGRDKDLSDSLDISRTDLDDSLEKRVTVTENAEVAWSEVAQRVGQKVTLGTENSVLSLISNCDSAAHAIQEVAERPGILKKPRMGAHRSQRGVCQNLADTNKRNETVKRVRFVDQPSTTEVQTYITKQPSYLSQVPTLQKPTKTLPYRSPYHKAHSSSYGDSTVFKYDTGATTLPFSTFDSDRDDVEPSGLHGKMPTDEEINDLWSEIQSYFRAGTVAKTRNGMNSTERTYSESSGHLGNRTDGSFVAQKGYSPVTHLSVGGTGSRYRQQTSTRADHIQRYEPEGTRRCISPVQITFSNSSLRTKETTKPSDSSKLLTKDEQRIQQSLDKLNYRLQGISNQSGVKYGSSTAATVKKKSHALPMTKDTVYGRPVPHKSGQNSPASISQ